MYLPLWVVWKWYNRSGGNWQHLCNWEVFEVGSCLPCRQDLILISPLASKKWFLCNSEPFWVHVMNEAPLKSYSIVFSKVFLVTTMVWRSPVGRRVQPNPYPESLGSVSSRMTQDYIVLLNADLICKCFSTKLTTREKLSEGGVCILLQKCHAHIPLF